MSFDFGKFFSEIISVGFNLLIWVFIIRGFTKKFTKSKKGDVPEKNNVIASPQGEAIYRFFTKILGSSRSLQSLAMTMETPEITALVGAKPPALDQHKIYLQVALNGSWEDARQIIYQLPNSERILIEAGTPFIKRYGINIISDIRALRPQAYIVADLKTVDLGAREAKMAADAGANAVIGLGVAPIETLNALSAECATLGLDMFLDLMNVEQPLAVLKQLEKLPKVVLLHRGVDETETDRAKTIPYFQINQIKGAYKMMVAVAGADSEHDVKSAVFNGADIVVLWKSFYKFDGNVGQLAEKFLANIK